MKSEAPKGAFFRIYVMVRMGTRSGDGDPLSETETSIGDWMLNRISISLIALILAAAPTLQAQDASLLGAGTRVKLVTPALDVAQQTGTVVSATRDTITFRSDVFPVTRSLAVADLTSLEISGGKETHRGRDALYGLAIGGSAGALLGAATYKKPKDCYWFCDTRSTDTVAGAIAGGLLGTLIGAFIVGSNDKTERWVPLRKTASIRLIPNGAGVKLAMSASF